MNCIPIKDRSNCRYDVLALGEVMLRLDPGEGRIRSTRQFQVWEGGGEYNVARSLQKCFGFRPSVITALAYNEVGSLIEDLIMQGGVDTSHIKWIPYDGIGRHVRNGINFTERGFGIRGALGCSDRGHTAISQVRSSDFDWQHLFGELGTVWLHTGGVFAGLSELTPKVILEATRVARHYGTAVSYDLNYRPSLWNDIGGLEKCQKINREIVRNIDVLIGNEGHFSGCLGIDVDEGYNKLGKLSLDSFQQVSEKIVEEFPNIKFIASTRRNVISATKNDWSAWCYFDGHVYQSIKFCKLEIIDRVGGGDGFVSGLLYGLTTQDDPQLALNYGIAHGALVMTTPGDTSMASLQEVENTLSGVGANEKR